VTDVLELMRAANPVDAPHPLDRATQRRLRDAILATHPATRPDRLRTWWGGLVRRRVFLFATATVLAAGGAAGAIAALTGERSAPVSGSIPGAVSSPHSGVGPYTYRVGVTPSLADGVVGWCVSMTEHFPRVGRLGGVAGQGVSCGERLGSPFVGLNLGGVGTGGRSSAVIRTYVYLTTSEVAAVRISPTLTILTRRDRSLPQNQRIAIAFARTRENAPEANPPVPLSSNGRPIPVRPVPSPASNLAVLAQPGQPAACKINTTGLPHAKPTYGQVVQYLNPFPKVAPGTLLPCAYTIFTYHGETIDAAILLDARHPGAPPGPLPVATRLSTHPETVNQPARLTGIGLAMTARRVGNAWLVIETNGTPATRLEILDHLHTCVRLTGRPCA
jgi:hypothetical protein